MSFNLCSYLGLDRIGLVGPSFVNYGPGGVSVMMNYLELAFVFGDLGWFEKWTFLVTWIWLAWKFMDAWATKIMQFAYLIGEEFSSSPIYLG